MPLKPIFEKAPLKSAVCMPLRPGQLQLKDDTLNELQAVAEKQDYSCQPVLWEGMLRLGALTEAHPEKLPVAALIQEAMERQQENGALPMSMTDSLAVARAAWALYEATARRELLRKLLLWCGSLAADWDTVTASADIRRDPADLTELLEQLYRVTGRKALLAMVDRLRAVCMNWAGALHTFSVQQPMSRVTPVKELLRGIEEENSEEGFYTRQALTCHGALLADGARASVLMGTYSGNGQELSAARVGWEKISRYHGAICGGIQCDELLAGSAPSAGVDAGALGAWLQALCAALQQEDDTGLWNALALIRANALPKAVRDDNAAMLQYVNCLDAEHGAKAVVPFGKAEDRSVTVLARLLRGAAALWSHAVTAAPDGIHVMLPVTGRCSCVADGKPFTLQL